MTDTHGQQTIDRLGSRDLNEDGRIINLAVVGSSRFYDFDAFERAIGCLLYTSDAADDC